MAGAEPIPAQAHQAARRSSPPLAPQLTLLPATTLAGMRAKARFVQEFNNCSPGYARPWQDDAMARSLANDLLGQASVWRSDDDDEPST